MRVKYSQTPPPVLEEADGMVQVTKQLTQVRDNNLNTDPIQVYTSYSLLRSLS